MATGGGGDPLATQYIEFVATGLGEVQQGLDNLQQSLAQVDAGAKTAGEKLGAMGGQASSGLSSIFGEIARTTSHLTELNKALSHPTYQTLVEELVEVKSKLDLSKEVASTTENLYKLQSQLKTIRSDLEPSLNLYEQFSDSLYEISENLGRAPYEESSIAIKHLQESVAAALAPTKDMAQTLSPLGEKLKDAREKLAELHEQVNTGDLANYRKEMAEITSETAKLNKELERQVLLQDPVKNMAKLMSTAAAPAPPKAPDFYAAFPAQATFSKLIEASAAKAINLEKLIQGMSGGLAAQDTIAKAGLRSLEGLKGATPTNLEEQVAQKHDQLQKMLRQMASGELPAATRRMAELDEQINKVNKDLDAIYRASLPPILLTPDNLVYPPKKRPVQPPPIPQGEEPQGEEPETPGRIYTIKSPVQAAGGALKNAALEAVQGVGDELKKAASDAVTMGRNIVQGIVKGMQAAGNVVASAGRRLAQVEIVGTIKGELGISSPSTVMAEVGRWIAEGIKQGFDGAALQSWLRGRMAVAVGEAREQVKGLADALGSGDYATHAAEMAKITQEMERLRKAAHWEDLKAQHGLLGAALITLQSHLNRVSQAGQQAGQGIQQGLFRTVLLANLASQAITSLVGSFRSWISQGMQGTTIGAAIAVNFQLISREIVGIFLPAIHMVLHGLQQVTQWLRSLTGNQQDSIMYWIAAGAAALAAAKAFSMVGGALASFVIGLLSTAIPAFSAFVTAIVTGSGIISTSLDVATMGLTLVLKAIAFVVSAAASIGVGLAVGTESGRSALKDLWDALKPIGESMIKFGKQAYESFRPFIELVGGTVGRMLLALGTGLARAFERLQPSIAQLGGDLQTFATGVLPMIEKIFREKIVPAIEDAVVAMGRLIAAGQRFILLPFWGPLRRNIEESMRTLTTAKPPERPEKDHRTAMLSGGQFEDVTNLWRRLQSEAFRVTTESAETKELKEANLHLKAIEAAAKGRLAGVGPRAAFGPVPGVGKADDPGLDKAVERLLRVLANPLLGPLLLVVD